MWYGIFRLQLLRAEGSSTLSICCRVQRDDVGNILRVVLPDVGVFVVSLVVFVICRKFIGPRRAGPAGGAEAEVSGRLSRADSLGSVRTRVPIRTTVIVNLVAQFLVVLFLAGEFHVLFCTALPDIKALLIRISQPRIGF